jgi:hypothetical protein
MLDKIKIAYDPTENVDEIMQESDATHQRAAFYLSRGRIPSNLLDVGAQSTNFRDAVLYHLLDQSSREELKQALVALTKAISSLDDGDIRLLGYSEYASIIATVLDERTIAAKVIKRNQLSTSSTTLKSVALAVSKSMSGSQFFDVIKNSSRNAVQVWAEIERPVLYPND